MHECAEFGLAAHWLYKETDNMMRYQSDVNDSKIDASPYKSKGLEDEAAVQNKYTLLKEGHPVLRVEGSQLLEAVIVRYLQIITLSCYLIFEIPCTWVLFLHVI